jgi:hypothetical protein
MDSSLIDEDGAPQPDLDAATMNGDAGSNGEPDGGSTGVVDGAVATDASAMDGGGVAGDGGQMTDTGTSTCVAGFASCGSSPAACETQLGTVTNCAGCGDVCPANGGTPRCTSGACSVACDLSGAWGIKLAVALSWPSGMLSAGTDTGTIWLLLQTSPSGGQLDGTAYPCGLVLPDFTLNPVIANEVYHFDWSTSMFDRQPSNFSPSSTTVSSVTGFTLGTSFTMSQIVVMAGASLSNPASDPWPSAASLSAPDMDMDGKAGVTAIGRSGGGYVYARAALDGSSRADRIYSAARFVFNGSGTINACNQLSGAATFTNFDTHVIGCRVAGTSSDCTTAQRDVLDTGRPAYTAGNVSLSATKLAAGATCANVRSALP